MGSLLCLFCVLPATPRRKTLFEKNFLDLSVEEAHWDAHCYACLEGRALGRLLCLFCVLPATPGRKTLFENGGTPIWEAYYAYSVCCLPPQEEEKLYFEKNFLDLSVEGRPFGKPTMPILCAACHPEKKNFI